MIHALRIWDGGSLSRSYESALLVTVYIQKHVHRLGSEGGGLVADMLR